MVLMERLEVVAEDSLPDYQCGFRATRGCMQLILALRLMQQNCLDSGVPMVACYVDLQRAFDSPPKQLIIDRLRHIGVPISLTEVVGKMNANCKAHMTGDTEAKIRNNPRG